MAFASSAETSRSLYSSTLPVSGAAAGSYRTAYWDIVVVKQVREGEETREAVN